MLNENKEKKVTRKTIFVVEASSYQLAYSKYFKSKFSLIINISPDHLERHNTMKNYILSKLKCVTKQSENDVALIANNNLISFIDCQLVVFETQRLQLLN